MSQEQPVSAKQVEKIKLSYARCLEHKDFFEKFYKNFFNVDSRVPGYFQKTNFEQQRKALRYGVEYLIMYAEGSRIGETKIEELGLKHDRRHLNIPVDLYDKWMQALLTTIKQHDSSFNDELEKLWPYVLSFAIAQIKSKY